MAKRKTGGEVQTDRDGFTASAAGESIPIAANAATHENTKIAAFSVAGEKSVYHERKSKMKILGFILALFILPAVCGLGYVVYTLNEKMMQGGYTRGIGSSGSDIAQMQNTIDRANETIRTLQQNIARISMESSQNTRAIDDMKSRINQLIDLVK